MTIQEMYDELDEQLDEQEYYDDPQDVDIDYTTQDWFFTLYHFLIMNTKLMISALRQGKTGEQILAILDAITSDVNDTQPVDGFVTLPTVNVTLPVVNGQPTLEEIAFWSYCASWESVHHSPCCPWFDAILPLLKRNEHIMWDEIQDMPGEIFDMSDEDREEFARVCMMNEEEYMMYMHPEQFNFAAWNDAYYA